MIRHTYTSRRAVLRSIGVLAVLAARPVFAAAAPLKIGTIGAGNIGSNLGGVWIKNGHEVMFSSRHPEELKDMVAALGPRARAGTVAEAIAFADVVLLGIPWSGMPDLGREHGKALASKQLVLDATNPILPRDGEAGAAARAKGPGLAAAELMPGAPLVRAFNAIGAARFSQGGRNASGARIGIPIAGDNAKALEIAAALINETGFEPVHVGSLDFGKNLMPGTPLAGEHTPEEIRRIASTLK